MTRPSTTETETETEPGLDKGRVKSFACNECGETRNLFDFYDDTHCVYITVDMGIYIDHGAGRRALGAKP